MTDHVVLRDFVLDDVMLKPCSGFQSWLGNLPKSPIEGLAIEGLDWIRGWSNGGGDYDVEFGVKESIHNLKSDLPKQLAEAVYNGSVCSGVTPFEASVLAMDLVDDSIAEIQYQALQKVMA